MPTQGPGARHKAVATKAVLHGDPCIEDNIPGMAFKTTPAPAYTDPTSAAMKTVQVGEEFEIEVGGMIEARTAAFVAAALPTKGAKLYIVTASNLLSAVSTGNVKYGIASEIVTARGLAKVNTNARDAI